MVEEAYIKAKEYFEKKEFVEALKLFSQMEYMDSKQYENECIDCLEDLIFYSKKKKSLEYLEALSFYKEYSYFTDAYKRRRVQWISKLLMFGSAIIGTLILILLYVL